MHSLVVLLSAMALAVAKPSLYETSFVSYAAPTVAVAPAAVSHQSRVDIKSTPAIINTEVVLPVRRAIIAEQANFASPTAYAAPAVYATPIVAAPAVVSSQSRIDIKSSPAVLKTVALSPTEYGVPLAAQLSYGSLSVPLAYSAPFTTPIAYSTPLNGFSAFITKPEAANLLVASTTSDIIAARTDHIETKALEESHSIQRRSVVVAAAPPPTLYAANCY